MATPATTSPSYTITDISSDEMLLNMGPQHPSTHGVFKVLIRTDGEVIVGSEPHIGFLHRSAEKIGENVTYVQFTPYTDRLDYLSSMSDNLAYCIAVERLFDADEKKKIVIPPRGDVLRLLTTELQRIASHLLAVGTYGLDVGAITPFLHTFREREMILMLFEKLCGQRLNYNYIRVGGVRFDVPDGWLDEVKRFLDWIDKKIPEYNNLLSYNEIFIKRTGHVGIASEDVCRRYCLTGPMLRASALKDSDLDRDLRRDWPYSLYKQAFDEGRFRVITCDPDWGPMRNGDAVRGDCWARYMLRIDEIIESIRLCRWALEILPEGPVHSEKLLKNVRPPKGEIYRAAENPRGELGFHIISDGTTQAVRIKIRSPAFVNISCLDEISRGCMLADMVAIIGSADIVLGEIDR